MANELVVDGRVQVKDRNPWGVVGLTLITLGIYHIFWFYYINREMRDFGAARNDPELAAERPGISVLAITLGAIIIVPAIVSFFKTVGRIRRTQQLLGYPEISMGLVVVLYIFLGIFALYVMQDGLSKAWRSAAGQTATGGLPTMGVA